MKGDKVKAFNIVLSTLILSIVAVDTANALPMDWSGAIGFDTNTILNVRRTDDSCTAGPGSQCVEQDSTHARFQSYVLRLNPSIIINDSATFKSELSTSNTRGNFLGDRQADGEEGNGSAYSTQPSSSSLQVNQAYVELYADTGVYRVGKFSRHFGLGAVVNGGNNTWDRYFTQFDGLEAEFRLGKFSVLPSWSRVFTNTDTPNGKSSVVERSLIAKYEDLNKQLLFGFYYGVREAQSYNTLYGTSNQAGQGASEITFIDIYVEKHFDNLKLAIEIPMMSGDIGDLGNGDTSIDARAYIFESSYQLNPKWNVGLNVGYVSGDDASTDSFEGMYLNPNFKIAEILYRYDYFAFNDSTRNDIFDGAVNNSTYIKLFANYKTSNYGWNIAFITANANQVAEAGNPFYDHDYGQFSGGNANADQSTNLGLEIDTSFDYYWNPSILVSAYLGYLQTGDYFAFIDDANNELELQNVIAHGF
jgi:hypothetical protein